jgi:hypothetical protein
MVTLRVKNNPAGDSAKNRALRGSALTRSGPTCRGGDFGRGQEAATSPPSGEGKPGRCGCSAPLQSLAHEPATASLKDRRGSDTPVAVGRRVFSEQ